MRFYEFASRPKPVSKITQQQQASGSEINGTYAAQIAPSMPTSSKMIDGFYASKLKVDDNAEMLQSHRLNVDVKATAKSE